MYDKFHQVKIKGGWTKSWVCGGIDSPEHKTAHIVADKDGKDALSNKGEIEGEK